MSSVISRLEKGGGPLGREFTCLEGSRSGVLVLENIKNGFKIIPSECQGLVNIKFSPFHEVANSMMDFSLEHQMMEMPDSLIISSRPLRMGEKGRHSMFTSMDKGFEVAGLLLIETGGKESFHIAIASNMGFALENYHHKNKGCFRIVITFHNVVKKGSICIKEATSNRPQGMT